MDRWMGSSRKPSEPIRTAFIDLLVRNRVIRVYEIKGGGGGREKKKEKEGEEDRNRSVAGRGGAKENRCVPVGHIFQAGNLRRRTGILHLNKRRRR